MICGQCGKTIWAAEGEPCICSCQKDFYDQMQCAKGHRWTAKVYNEKDCPVCFPRMTREQAIDAAVLRVVGERAFSLGRQIYGNMFTIRLNEISLANIRAEFRKIMAAQ